MVEYYCLGCSKQTLDSDFCLECYCCDNCDGLGGICTNTNIQKRVQQSEKSNELNNKEEGKVCNVCDIQTDHRSTITSNTAVQTKGGCPNDLCHICKTNRTRLIVCLINLL